jgi:hypothetical protein
MSLHFIPRATAVAVVAVFAVTVAMAQPVADANIVNSTGAQTTPHVQYSSAFSDYVPYSEQTIDSWRQANDTVGEIGGWRTYAKEARQPDTLTVKPQLNTSSLATSDKKEVK